MTRTVHPKDPGSAVSDADESESAGSQSSHGPRELRIAVVMTGGVSLCIWMGGTGLELDLLRRREGIYGQILGAVGAEPVVDIIGGTSAGGLNGTLLASAIAWDSNLDGLGDIWFDLADFGTLLQLANAPDPRSLLQGDSVFLPQIEKYLSTLRGDGRQVVRSKGSPDLHLLVTTTPTKPWDVPYVDGQGTAFSEPTYQGVFHFVQSETDDDFANANSSNALACAARSSASFPVAFEASYASVGPGAPADVDMAPYANFPASRYVLDGGLIDNDPLDDVLDAISSQPATGSVHRTILFVNPLGSLVPSPGAVPRSEAPSVFKVIEDSVMIPRQHSNVNLYNKLRLRQDQAGKIRNFRTALFAGLFDIGYPEATGPSTDVESPGPTTNAGELIAVAKLIAPEVVAHRSRMRARQGESSTPDYQGMRQSLLIVQDLLGRAVSLYGIDGFEEVRVSVAACLHDGGPGLPDGAATALEDAMAALTTRLPQPHAAQGAGELQLSLEVHGIEMMGRASDSADSPSVDWDLALGALGVLQCSVTDGDVHNPQQIGFVELSAAESPTSGLTAEQKLTGVQMAHFGAFYAQSWRRNDWIWGRLDGSYRLIAMLVDPEFLLESGAPNEIASRLAAVRGGDEIEVDAFATAIAGPLTELASLPSGPVRLDTSRELQRFIAEQIWNKRRTDILRTELPDLIASVRADERAGVKFPSGAQEFLAIGSAISSDSSASDLLAAWNLAPNGGPRLAEQAKTRRFAEIASQAATVGAGVFDDSIPWWPVRLALKPVRWALRMVNIAANFRSKKGSSRQS
jgi:hypothetical protein